MAAVNELNIGAIPNLNELVMYRKFTGRFQPNYLLDENDNLLPESNVFIYYYEYIKDSNEEIIPDLKKIKYYVIPNRLEVPATYYVEGDTLPEGKEIGDEKTALIPAWMAANDWFNVLARGPVSLPEGYGIVDRVEYTLQALPSNIPDGYILVGE